MNFDPNKFFELANELAQNTADEASLRTAVGRAYYSVFLLAREKLGLQGSRRHIHSLVIAGLRSADYAAGSQLDKLETLRGEADYDLSVQDVLHRDWRSNWSSASQFATHILRRLNKL